MKILSPQEARQRLNDTPACWVSGCFDPLLAEHVRRLQQYQTPGKLLVVEVTESARQLLTQRARAELVAALSIVDYVVLAEPPTSEKSNGADRDITERFIQHVQRRHCKETAG